MNKKDTIILQNALQNVGELKGVKFAYGVSRNIELLKAETMETIKELKLGNKYEEFVKKQNKLYQMEYDRMDQLILEYFKVQFKNNEI